MIRRPPRATRTDTLFPYTTLFRSVEPGSIRSVTARLRCDARWPDSTALGLYDGRLAIASTSPGCTSSTTADALSAPLSSRSEERRGGKEGGRTGRCRVAPANSKKKQQQPTHIVTQ